MKKIFYIGVAGIVLFEIAKVYLIMPMPGSQEMNSLDVAYFLHTHRWYFRIFFGVMIIAGGMAAFRTNIKWIPLVTLMVAFGVVYVFNFEMLADKMFKQPSKLMFKSQAENLLTDSSIVIGVAYGGEAKAYPIRFLVYHHQVQDTIGGKPMIITYCSVCRTGRVFDPTVNSHHETFRLVGMDHFNAMFEDATTKSWWRQVTGEAVAGPLTGTTLTELESSQVTLAKWFERYPEARVMQLDEASRDNYDSLGRFERGRSKGKLTRTDSLSWKDKSWVVGIEIKKDSKAYDWNLLREVHIINDHVGGMPIVLALSTDEQSFIAFERPADTENFTIRNDTLFSGLTSYDFSGRDVASHSDILKQINASQEFWHSWKTFHPETKQY